uniref:FCP1 homology domain-containing protein n=2 Tax=Aegilops tauschii TaxID=37682 RepID=A0A452ZB31_AEGTS
MAAATEVYSPTPAAPHREQAAWWAVVGWLGLLLQVLLRVIRGAPSSLAKLLRSLGLRHPLLSAAPAVAFVQLPSKAPADDLPPLSPPPGRLTVVLDLDETLVCAYESSSLPATVRTQAVEAGLHCFDMEGISSDK